MTEKRESDWELERAERARIISLFSVELSSRLGRSKAEITKNGLSVSDFGPAGTNAVEIVWGDKSQAKFNGAFAIMSADCKRVAVFTEHCGYFVMQAAAIEAVYENQQQTVFFNQEI